MVESLARWLRIVGYAFHDTGNSSLVVTADDLEKRALPCPDSAAGDERPHENMGVNVNVSEPLSDTLTWNDNPEIVISPPSPPPIFVDQTDAATELLEEIIHNEYPIRLLFLPTKELLSRPAIWEMVRPIVLENVDTSVPWDEQAGRIRDIIHKVLSYAILSHRWLPKGEVPFFTDKSEITMKKQSMAGSLKYYGFCAIARQHGCKWAWMDTCCINKNSSSELDESIRSMYRWYQRAYVCVVHLRGTYSLSDMTSDEWFRRGWTLQELLAPKRIKFYNAEWEELLHGPCYDIDRTGESDVGGPRTTNDQGHDPETESHSDLQQNPLDPTVPHDTESLLIMISKVTSIPVHYLRRSFEPGTDKILEKMVWASKRRTTRIEDRAYSLIGLFDVALTIAYGEGDRAFYRLQTAIMDRSSHKTLFMWSGQRCAENSMFAKSPQCFATADISDVKCDLVKFLNSDPRMPPTLVDHDSDPHVLDYFWVDFSLAMITRGSRECTLTHAGLRMNMILYEVTEATQLGKLHWHISAKGLEPFRITGNSKSAEEFAGRGGQTDSSAAKDAEGRNGGILQTLIRSIANCLSALWTRFLTIETSSNAEPLGVFEVKAPTDRYQLHERDFHKRLRIAVLDYERQDAHDDPYDFKRQIFNTWNVFQPSLPNDQELLTRVILRARATRKYTAILLHLPAPGDDRPFQRVSTERIIEVRRPAVGWKKPQCIYIR